jgi:signal transduction histidine kinase/ligand-binding sensor domain-containing protein
MFSKKKYLQIQLINLHSCRSLRKSYLPSLNHLIQYLVKILDECIYRDGSNFTLGFFIKRTLQFFCFTAALCLAFSGLVVGGRAQGNSRAPVENTILQPQPAIDQTQSDLRFERLTPADGLSFPLVRSVIQDQYGFMWFATENGLNKFDGYTFTVYKNDPGDPNSLSSDDLRVVFEDSDGDIWIGGTGGLDKYDRSTGTFEHVDPDGIAFCILEDSSGMLWVGYQHGLFGYDRAHNRKVFAYPSHTVDIEDHEAISPGAVQTLLEDTQNNLWIGTSAGLDHLDRETRAITHYTHDPSDSLSLSGNDVHIISEDSHGYLWIGTENNGLDRFHLASETFKHYRIDSVSSDPISSNTVLAIWEDQNRNLWLGTVNGLNQYLPNENRFLHYRHDPENSDSLSDNIIYDLYEDRSGVLWIATANGVSKFIPRTNQFTYLRFGLEILPIDLRNQEKNKLTVDLSESKVLSIFEDRDGMIWFGTLLDGLYKYNPDSGEMSIYRHEPTDPNSIISNQVYSIYQDRVGVLWIGTGNGWLEQFDPETEKFIHSYQQEGEIVSIVEDSADNLWIGTQGQGISRLKFDEQFLFESSNPAEWIERVSMWSNIVETVYIDHFGVPWVGTANDGINVWDNANNRFSSYRNKPEDPSSLSHNHVISFFEEPNRSGGVMWVGTMGGGLNRFDYGRQTFSKYTVVDGLGDDIINCILADDDGYLWMSTPKGLTRFDPGTEIFRNYDAGDGVSSGTSHPGICLRSAAGDMYFGTPGGVIVFDPEKIEDNLHRPPIVITDVNVNDQTVLEEVVSQLRLKLSYWENYLSFEFAALDYTAPEKNNYAYRMEGVDDDWVYAGTRRYADYPDLRPGDYVFWVKGSNNDGVWTDESIPFHITVVPPFWQSWWFIGLAGFLVVASVFVGSRWRVRNLEIQSRALERQVKERTQEITRQRQQIEALYRADEDIYRHLELERILQALVDTAVQILQADKGAVLCWDDARENLVVRASTGFAPETVASMIIPRGKGVVGWVAEHGEPATVENIVRDFRVTSDIVEPEGIHAFAQVPIKVGDDIFGVFSADYVETRSFSDDEIRLLVSLAQRAAMAIQNAQLYKQGRELAATQERNRLARELHDAVTQSLFSASLIAEALPALWERDADKGRDRLAKLRQMSRGALAEMRALLLELRPTALLEANLDDLLHQLGEVVAGREGIPVTVEIDANCDLPEDLHIALYRIAQEALNNVVKHARAQQVEVRLQQTCQEDGQVQAIELCVCDDGCGFNPQDVTPERLGLKIMQERAQAIGAEFMIESQLEAGTIVSIRWQQEVV